MKIAFNDVGEKSFTNNSQLRKSKNSKKFFEYLNFQSILFFLLFIPFYSYSLKLESENIYQKKGCFDTQNFSDVNMYSTKTFTEEELDTDNDGIVDILDFDDDNDGILDHNEGFYNLNTMRGKSIVITINGSWVLVPTSVYFDIPENLEHGDEFWIPFMGEKYVKAVRLRFENSINGIKLIQTAAKHTIGNDPELDENLDYDFDNGGIVSPIALADSDEGYGIASISYLDKILVPDYLGSLGQVVAGPELDTDNDGLIDSRDTDSDNDGCPDAIEGENNLTAIATLSNGSNGGSIENLGTLVNNNGIPLPLGTLNGNEELGQNNSKASITSELLYISPFSEITLYEGENLNIEPDVRATRTATFNIGVPNFSIAYGTDTSHLISYEWYKTSDLNSIISTSKNLILNDVSLDNSGTYMIKIKGANNRCTIEEIVNITIEPSNDDVLGGLEDFALNENRFITYPNPSKGDINLLLKSKEDANTVILLYDISGKEVFSILHKLTVGKNKITLTPNVSSGIFFLKVMSKKVNYGVTKIVFK